MRGLNWFLFLFPRALACCCYRGEKEVFSRRYNPNFKFRNGRRWVQKQGSSSKKIRQTKWLSFWPDQHHSLHFMLFLRPTFRYVDRFFVHRQLHDVTRAMIQLHLEISITHSATAQKISFLPFSSERRKCVFFSCLRWPSKNGRCQKKKVELKLETCSFFRFFFSVWKVYFYCRRETFNFGGGRTSSRNSLRWWFRTGHEVYLSGARTCWRRVRPW